MSSKYFEKFSSKSKDQFASECNRENVDKSIFRREGAANSVVSCWIGSNIGKLLFMPSLHAYIKVKMGSDKGRPLSISLKVPDITKI